MSPQAEISYLALPEALQDVFIRQRTGVMFVRTEQGRERLVVLAGQLYLSDSNPGRERLERVLAGPEGVEDDPRFDPASYLTRELEAFVRELVDTLAEWRTTDLRFSSELGDMEEDLVGPVPTAALIMDLYSRGWNVEELLRRLGGVSARYRAVEDERFRRRVSDLDPDELALLRRLERTASIETLIAEEPEASSVVCRLVRLSAVGLLSRESYPGVPASTISQEIIERISDRVRENLEVEPLELDIEAHRARVSELLQEYGRLCFFDLLGVGRDDAPEKVHAAFMKLARLAHPVHAENLGLLKSRRKLDWLFGRLTEAYLVLSDPARCAEYKRGGSAPPPRSIEPDARARRTERVGMARECFRAALDHIEEDDYYYAIELLRQAVLSDEQPEYYALLGRCQMRNRKWLHMAVDSFRRALALRPDDAELRRELVEATKQYRNYQEKNPRQGEVVPAAREKADARRVRRILSKLRGEGD